MEQARWLRVEELYHSALERAPEARFAFLEEACSDSDLRREVETLLEQSGDGVLDHPAVELIAGGRLGPYEILGVLGAGGMGTVYKARDSRVDRTVAIKVSSAQFSGRFEREARAVAALNHPNICTLYDVGPNYLVMEYVEGKPLGGSLPENEALRLAGQLLDALDAAHCKGIVHRDLKPANILVTKSGVKVLDFGLAKMESPVSAGTEPVTQKGSILGTLHYMSPEQVQGKQIDARSDLFSFGLLLYEMLTGRRAFEGENSASVMAGILEREPAKLEEIAPFGLQRVLRRCLAKDADERWQSARDLKAALEGSATAVPQQAKARPSRLAWAALAIGAVAGIAFLLLPGKPDVAYRFDIIPPEGTTAAVGDYLPLAVSPDGRKLAFVAISEGKRWLWVRSLASDSAQRLANTEYAGQPFWSPDGQQIGYWAVGAGSFMLKRVPATGGSTETICLTGGSGSSGTAHGGNGGGTWNRGGTILIALGNSPIYRVPASGGEPRAVTKLDAAYGETGHSMPEFLPDGRHFLFWANNRDPEKQAIVVGSLDSPERQRVIFSKTMAKFAEPDFLLFSRDGRLFAQHLDLKRFRLTGSAAALAENVHHRRPAFSASNGVLAYRQTADTGPAMPSQMAWYGRDGKRLESVGDKRPITQRYFQFRLSPNERYAAVEVLTGASFTAAPNVTKETTFAQRNLYLMDFTTKVMSRITFHEGFDNDAVWSPDSRRILYMERDGPPPLPERLMELTVGEHAPRIVREEKGFWINPHDLSPDGQMLLFGHNGGAVYSLRLEGGQKPITLLDLGDKVHLEEAHFSPDGRWVAYNSTESGQYEVYVASFPGMRGKKQVSNGGGCIPFWRKDSRELFYQTLYGRVMSVTVKTGSTFDASAPQPLFQAPAQGAVDCILDKYAVTGDGQKFLMFEWDSQTSVTEPIHVILHWDAEMRR
jgi:eukaryotic-like serine/threonine-protein kinase